MNIIECLKKCFSKKGDDMGARMGTKKRGVSSKGNSIEVEVGVGRNISTSYIRGVTGKRVIGQSIYKAPVSHEIYKKRNRLYLKSVEGDICEVFTPETAKSIKDNSIIKFSNLSRVQINGVLGMIGKERTIAKINRNNNRQSNIKGTQNILGKDD